MKERLIKLFKDNKNKKTSGIPHLNTVSYQDGWGFLYDVYCEEKGSVRVASTHILRFSRGCSLAVEEYPITLDEYEKLIKGLPKRYKRFKKVKR